MRNSTSGSTPKTNKVQDETSSSNAERASAKKLKQARLPFKVIAPGTSPVGTKTTTTTVADKEKDSNIDCNELRNGQAKDTRDGRKRKLSYDTGDDDDDDSNAVKVDDKLSKENVGTTVAATKKKKIEASCSNDTTSELIVSLLDDDNVEHTAVVATSKGLGLKTPKAVSKDKQKGAGTPKTSSAKKDKTGSSSKLQIKLPLIGGKKNKRRKSKIHHTETEVTEAALNKSCAESSDDIEEVAVELNPQKRKKFNTKIDENITTEEENVETITLDSESDDDESNTKDSLTDKTKPIDETTAHETENVKTERSKTLFVKKDTEIECPGKESKRKEEETTFSPEALKSNDKETEESPHEILSDSSDEEKKDEKEDLDESVQSDNDNEADDETDNLTGKLLNILSDKSEDAKSKENNTNESLKDANKASSSAKNQTPKQIKLLEQRRKAREEKERKLQEEKKKKQQEKEGKELAKRREREEKEEHRRKEREEKEEQKRKEREEKERKRLAELEAKNEEKRKKNEAKEEELRKKEEDRKRKEQEKEEAELKKKKAAQAFTKFFVSKQNAQLKNDEDSNTEDGTKTLAFRPFQVKGDMKLAPLCRKAFTAEAKNRLDNLLGCRNKAVDEDVDEDIVRRKPLSKSQLYLFELRCGKILPGKWRRISTESKDDVILVDDELERVGQAIVEDTPDYVREQMRVKFYKFHDNRRPPYYGTWRKKSSVVKPRKPFVQDKKFFDYEVDSDDEWEEEEPGESLEDGSDDDKEKESEDDDYEVDNEWFVPHGHLSDEEMQNEDELGAGDGNTREAQKVKLQMLQQEFAQEMKKKTEKIKPRLIGCVWVDENGNFPAECAKILWDTLDKKAMLYTEPPIIEEPEVDKSTESISPSGASNNNAEKIATTDKLKPITLSDNMVKDLTRLIHGNNHSKNFLINEYIAYVEKTESSVKNGDLRKPLKSVVRDKIDEMAEWQVVNATASSIQDMEQCNDDTAESTKKKKKGKRRLCWVVKQEMLNKMDLSALELHNSWEYTLPPKFVKVEKDIKTEEIVQQVTTDSSNLTSTLVGVGDTKEKNATSHIAKLKKVTTTEDKSKNGNAAGNNLATSSSSTDKIATATKVSSPSTSQASKEKKRVPLLMSVARGQQISTPAKNKLISQFLQQKGKDTTSQTSAETSTTSRRSKGITSPTIEDDDVVVLD